MKNQYRMFIVALILSVFTFGQAYSQSKSQNYIKTFDHLSNGSESIRKNVVDGTGTLHKDIVNGTKTLHSDLSTIIDSTHSDAKQLIQYVGDKGEKIIVKVSEILGNVSVEVWNILVKQQLVKAWAILFAFIAYFSLIFYYKRTINGIIQRVKTDDDEWKTSEIWFVIIGGVILVCLSWFNISHAYTMFTGFLNPKYGALQDLLQFGKAFIIK